jgi:hypothetical protein
MIHRCENPKRDNYPRYGGRGIYVCDQWHNPHAFFDWALQNGYSRGLQIDRIDNNGNYCPENCRFVCPKENSRNTRRNVVLILNGISKTVAEWTDGTTISQFTVYWWIKMKGKDYAEQRLSRLLFGRTEQ